MRYYRNVFDLGDLNTALQEAFEIKQDRSGKNLHRRTHL